MSAPELPEKAPPSGMAVLRYDFASRGSYWKQIKIAKMAIRLPPAGTGGYHQRPQILYQGCLPGATDGGNFAHEAAQAGVFNFEDPVVAQAYSLPSFPSLSLHGSSMYSTLINVLLRSLADDTTLTYVIGAPYASQAAIASLIVKFSYYDCTDIYSGMDTQEYYGITSGLDFFPWENDGNDGVDGHYLCELGEGACKPSSAIFSPGKRWYLVFYAQTTKRDAAGEITGNGGDNLMLFQNKASSQVSCLMTFRGTKEVKDWASNFDSWPTYWCGMTASRGYTRETRKLFFNPDNGEVGPWYPPGEVGTVGGSPISMPAALASCDIVELTGYSQGAAVGQLIAGCVNGPAIAQESLDFKALEFSKSTSGVPYLLAKFDLCALYAGR